MKLAFIFAAVVSTAASAQMRPMAPAPALSGVVSCRTISEQTARLNCYDNAAAALARQMQTGEIVAVGRDDIRKTRRALFGLTLPSLNIFGGEGDEPEVKQIEATISSVKDLGYGKWLLSLDSGAKWQTSEALIRQEPRPGQKIVIKRGTLGGYMLTVNNGKAARAMRVQ